MENGYALGNVLKSGAEMTKKKSKKQELPEGLKPLIETPDAEILKDLEDVIVNGLISNTEGITYSLAILYNSLEEEDRKHLLEGILQQTKIINELYIKEVADKSVSAVDFMFALIYMVNSMNSTLMMDDGWRALFEHGQKVKTKYIEGIVKEVTPPTTEKKEVLQGYN